MANHMLQTFMGRKTTAAKILLISAFIFIYAITSYAATTITNMCTSTFQMTNGPITGSGQDTSAVRVQTLPSISINKYARNLRTGIEEDTFVTAVQGDTIEFRLVWQNTGEAKADTIVLRDYVPSGLTYVVNSVSDTEANCDSPTTATYNAGLVSYTGIGAAGTDPSPAANGVIRFRVIVN